ncbi:MAG: 2-dehydropantoate 2-reductase [Deltaproteobacteria bacterium]|nr:2-dehydropantoate 2-reductase [Deltaproteobacteria bacterium]
MNILIYGGGAVGLGLASCLLGDGHDVTILGRPASVALLNSKGLIRTGIFGTMTAESGSFCAVSSLAESGGKAFDFILVATKSFDSERAASDIHAHPHLLDQKSALVLCQNGWGNAEIFTRFFDEKKVFNARIITGFIRPQPHQVDITVHADAIHIGSLFSADLNRIDPLCQAITSGGIPCEPTEYIAGDLWAKMLFNCPLNSVGAICGVSYGALQRSPWSRTTMERIIREIFQVMAAAGYGTFWNTPEAYIDFFYATLIPRTAEHFSSTLQDLQAAKKTEIDALNGAVVSLAHQHGLDAPVNETVYNLIKFLEESRSEI